MWAALLSVWTSGCGSTATSLRAVSIRYTSTTYCVLAHTHATLHAATTGWPYFMAPFNTAAKNDVEAAPLDEDLRLRFRLVPDAARTHTHPHAVSANVATTPLPAIVAHSQRRVTYRRGRRSCYETGMERWHHVRPCHPDSSCTLHAQALAVPTRERAWLSVTEASTTSITTTTALPTYALRLCSAATADATSAALLVHAVATGTAAVAHSPRREGALPRQRRRRQRSRRVDGAGLEQRRGRDARRGGG